MNETELKNDQFVKSLTDSTKLLGFSVLLYDQESDAIYSVHKGELSETPFPESIRTYISDEKTFCVYFSRGEDLIVMYFMRLKVNKHRFVLILQDNKKHTRLNRFVASLFAALSKPVNSAEWTAKLADKDIELAEKDGVLSFLEIKAKEAAEQLKTSSSKYSEEITQLKVKIEKLTQEAALDKAIWNQEKLALEERLANQPAQAAADVNADDGLFKLWETAAAEELEQLRESVQQLPEMEEELALLRADNKDKDAQIEKLGREIELLSAKGQLEEMSLTEKDDAVVELKLRVQQLEKENAELAKELSGGAPSAVVSDLNKRITLIMKERDDSANKATNLKNDLQKAKDQLASNEGLYVEITKLKTDIQHLNTVNSKKDMQYEDAMKNVVEQQSIMLEKDKVIKELQSQVNDLSRKIGQSDDKYSQVKNTLLEKESLFSEREKQMIEMRATVEENTKQFNEMAKRTDSLNDLNQILRKSRDKLGEILNGLSQPLFTINNEYKIVTVNKALLGYCGANRMGDLIGHKCYEKVHKQKDICAWCMLNQVKESGEPMQVPVITGDGHNERHLDVLFFPVFDSDGTLIEVAEFINDKTEVVALANSIGKFKEKLRDFKKARIDDMNEVSEIKKSYHELSEDHDRIVDRNKKMIKVIERLVSEDKARELLNARTELLEVRNKLFRSTEMIKNYKYQLDEQLIKYSDLNRRTFLQMERLLNIMKSKTQVKGEESTTILNFLSREFELVKKHFVDTQKKADLHAAIEKPVAEERTEKAQTVFKSEEEKMLEEKLASEKTANEKADNKPAASKSNTEVEPKEEVPEHFV